MNGTEVDWPFERRFVLSLLDGRRRPVRQREVEDDDALRVVREDQRAAGGHSRAVFEPPVFGQNVPKRTFVLPFRSGV